MRITKFTTAAGHTVIIYDPAETHEEKAAQLERIKKACERFFKTEGVSIGGEKNNRLSGVGSDGRA